MPGCGVEAIAAGVSAGRYFILPNRLDQMLTTNENLLNEYYDLNVAPIVRE
jgi:hypothetical protein